MEENKIQENVKETKEEMTVFGKIDRWIVGTKTAHAEKKANKAKEKAEKKAKKEETSTEEKPKKKVPWKAIGIVAAVAAGAGLKTGADHLLARMNTEYELADGDVTMETAAIPEETESETVES